VRTPPGTRHVCYCLTPTRFVWDFDTYVHREQVHGLARRVAKPFVAWLKRWERQAAARVDAFAAISRVVQERVRRFYDSRSAIIYPPVDTDHFVPASDGQRQDYFLIVSRLIPYKRIDLAVRAFGIENPILFRARDARDEGVTSPAGIRTLWEIVDSMPYPLLITLGGDGFPWSRPMHLIARDGGKLWFPTSRTSRKAAQIEKNPRVAALFVDSVRFNYATIHGEASLVVDPERERALWRDEWRDDWPDGPADPDYVLLRVDGIRGHYLRGATGEAGTIDLTSDAA